jgi:hypothetical protein
MPFNISATANSIEVFFYHFLSLVVVEYADLFQCEVDLDFMVSALNLH